MYRSWVRRSKDIRQGFRNPYAQISFVFGLGLLKKGLEAGTA